MAELSPTETDAATAAPRDPAVLLRAEREGRVL